MPLCVRRVLAFSALSALSLGCSVLTSLSDLTGGTATDAGAVADAGPVGDARADAPSTRYRDRVLADQPIAYWRFGETNALIARDETLHHNDAFYTNGCTPGAAGAIANDTDTAVTFDGTTCRVSAPQILDFPGNAPFSLEAWARPKTYDAAYRMVFGKALVNVNGYQQFGIFFHLQADQGLVFERNVNDQQVKATFANPEVGKFVHVVGTYDGALLKIYVNGIAAGVAPDTRAQVFKPSALFIGSNGDENYFDGVIDEVAVYTSALSAQAIREHFVAGSGN